MKEWTERLVSDLIDGLTAGVSVRSTTDATRGPSVLKTSAIDEGRFDPKDAKRITIADRSRARCSVKADSMIVSRMNTPALVGDVGYVANEFDDLYLPDRLWMARQKRNSGTDMRWLTYFFASQPGARILRGLATGTSGSMKNIPKSRVLSLELAVPMPQEQKAIANALADTDRMITSLERLIAKKKAIQEGMMQRLLTGRARLPGFTGAWTEVAVALHSEVKARIGWQGLKTDEYRESGTYRLVGGTEFVDGHIDWHRTPFVDKWRYDQDKYIQLRIGDVLLTKDGTIGKTAFIDSLPGPATLNSGVFVIRPVRWAYDPEFLFWMLRSRAFDEFLRRLTAGSTISHLYQRDLVTLVVRVPPSGEEQESISVVLRQSEDEISSLRRKLNKVRAIKTGMMQQLLTGRIRLHVEAAS